jgi:glutaredoxin
MAEKLDVLILVQEGCHFCEDAQALLDRLGGEYPLRVRTMDMTTPEGERIALRAGLLFPPGILLQGRPVCYGRPSEGKLRRAIDHLLSEEPALGPTARRERA